MENEKMLDILNRTNRSLNPDIKRVGIILKLIHGIVIVKKMSCKLEAFDEARKSIEEFKDVISKYYYEDILEIIAYIETVNITNKLSAS